MEGRAVESAGLLAAIAEPVRWRLLARLADGIPTCVCDLQTLTDIAPNLLSYHLRVLREAGLVTTQKRGRWVDYTIAADAVERLRAALPTNANDGDLHPLPPGSRQAFPRNPVGARR